MTATGWAWLAAALVLAGSEAALSRGHGRQALVPGTVLALMAGAALVTAAAAGHSRHGDVRTLLVAGLVLAAIGFPAASRSPGPVRFVAGATLLVGAHLCWSLALLRRGTEQLSVVFGLVLALVALLSFGHRVIAAGHARGGALTAVGVSVHLAAAGSLVVLGIGTTSLAASAGVIVLAAGDLGLVGNRVLRERRWTPGAIRLLYHLGPALLVIGLLG